jgi:hypothetical protein
MPRTLDVEQLAEYAAKVTWNNDVSFATERYAQGTSDEDDTKERWMAFRRAFAVKLREKAEGWAQ